MEIKCYGWIPILTSYLLADNLHVVPEKIFPRECSDTDKTQKVDGSLVFDDNNYLTSIELDIPEVAHIKVICEIESTGLVYFYFDEIKFSKYTIDDTLFNTKTLPNWIFDIIRDIYHDHVHHGKDNDCKLSHVIAKNKNEAIRKIVNQYQNKIIEYHKDFKLIKNSYIISPTRIFKLKSKKQMYFLTTGCGEFTYAQSFINLHSNDISAIGLNSEILNKSFILADKSISTLKDKLSWRIMYRISFAAIVIAFISLIIGASSVYEFIEKTWPSEVSTSTTDTNILLKQ